MWEGGLADDFRGMVRQGSQILKTKNLQTQLGNCKPRLRQMQVLRGITECEP